MKKRFLFLALISLIFLGTVGCDNKKGEVYKATESVMFTEEYKIEISDESIVSVAANNVTNSTIETGGSQIELTMTGKKEGKATVSYIVSREDSAIQYLRVYNLNVDSNLNVTLESKESKAIINEGHLLTKKHNVVVSDESIISILEENRNNAKILDSGILFDLILTAKKEGTSVVSIEISDVDTNKIEETKKYEVIVDESLLMSVSELSE